MSTELKVHIVFSIDSNNRSQLFSIVSPASPDSLWFSIAFSYTYTYLIYATDPVVRFETV